MKSKFLRKTALIGIVFLCCQSFIQAQSTEQIELSENNLYLDATIGSLLQASINYERQIHSGEKVSWYGRIGVGYGARLFGVTGPGGLGAITMLAGKKNGHFELNAGGFIGQDADTYTGSAFINPIFNVGYRYQKPEGGFIFRAYAGIIVVGISLGHAF